MEYLIQYRTKLKLLKYISLSAGLCIFLAIIITLYIKNASDHEAKQPFQETNKFKLSKDYSLTINNPIFEGVTGNLNPYRILAQTVSKNLDNQYTLHNVNANCKINDANVNAKATNALLDDSNKLITLKENVQITLDDTVLKCEEIKLNLENQEITSDTSVEINLENSHIKADSLSTKDSNNIIELKGNIESNFDIKNFK